MKRNIEEVLAERGATRHCPACNTLQVYRIFWDNPAKGKCFECHLCGTQFDGDGFCGCGYGIERHPTGDQPGKESRACGRFIYHPFGKPKLRPLDEMLDATAELIVTALNHSHRNSTPREQEEMVRGVLATLLKNYGANR